MNAFGGMKVQARSTDGRERLLADARALQDAGAFALVLEGIPRDLAAQVASTLAIPTIGIGAGPDCDAQVLVIYDLLGITDHIRGVVPKFVKPYDNLGIVSSPRRAPTPTTCAKGDSRMMPTRSTDGLTRLDTPADLRRWSAACHAAGESVGMVPTMGALHAGHQALIDRAVTENDRVVVTIFVNPAQFGPGEDFARYPRNLDADLTVVAAAGVDAVFVPRSRPCTPRAR